MMPGPVSDSYDPEFGTGDNVDAVEAVLREVSQKVTDILGGGTMRDIVAVVRGGPGPSFQACFSEREWRVIRFALNRAAEDV